MTNKPVVLVTGGAGGIGAACARKLAAAYTVVLTDSNLEEGRKIAKELGGAMYECDVSSESQVNDVVAKAESEVGPIAGMVMCAGIIQDRAFGPEEFEQDHWDRVQSVNTRGTWLVCRAVGSRMAKRHQGSIVNIGSVAGHRAWPTHSYAASKAAVLSLTRGLAVEWGRSGVRVNSISPGFTLTPRLKELIKLRNWDISTVEQQTALGRWVEPDEIADAAEFLLSSKASAITGVDLPVDTGWLCGVNWLSFTGVPASR